jgi:hypothetical protein
MECEYRANLTQNRYDDLEPGEFRFDYKSWAYRLGFTKKQMERAIKELTTENIVIIQIEKGTRGTSSKYFLVRFKENDNSSNINSLDVVRENNIEEKKKEHSKRTIGEEKILKNTSVRGCVGEQKVNEKEKQKEQSSQYNNLNIIFNNIYSHWNSKKIIVHKSLNKDMEKAVEKALKKYSEAEIVQAIDTYSEILGSDFYFSYKWSLVDFLNRQKGISTFMNDGSNKINYEDYKKKSIQTKKVVNYDSYID